ncbi:MAG TPA: Ig domain-containing protein, partial [Flavisolibacter sp.]|nr:Ig domain-containing protein [Flavisolibacter sp.]
MRIQNGKRQSFFLLFLTLMSSLVAIAQQAPTSLKYPSSVVAITNFSNVYLAPTVSGSVTTYSISPALPTGLSLAANTGIITGTPTVASPATTYTITAANASGSATTTLTLQVTTSYFDNAYGQLRFTGTPTAITGTTGMANGNRMLYRNVATISGTQIDCIITTVDQSNVQWEAYDQEAPTGTFYDSNNPNFFSPQFNFTAAGFVSFNFQFILGNSYNATTSPNGIPVTLQNVYINTYDIDGNGNARQYNSFSGFDSYQLGNPTIEQVTYDGTYASTRFTANNNTNFPTVIDPQTRVRTTYKNVSNFPIVVGANGGGTNPNGLAYFFFDFNSGSTFSTAVSTQAPSLDLNTSTTGVSNAGLNCGGAMNFTSGGTNFNAASPATTKLEVSFPIGDIKDGANEQFVIGTATRNLHENGNAATSVTIGGETWSITGTSSGSTRTLIFTPTGTASPARTEALLDVLQYRNSATAATNGTRNFTVNVFGGTMVSPDAVFSAEVNCVSISGNIYRDANGLSDNTVNANGTQLAINGAYAVL